MSLPIYKILVWDCICDIGQLTGVALIGGTFTLANSTYSRPLNHFINWCWETRNLLDLVVAFDRFLAIAQRHWAEKMFSNRKSRIWVAACFFIGFCINGVYLLRDGGVLYNMDDYAWEYTDKPDSDEQLVAKIELVIDFTTEPLMLLFCIGIAVKMIHQRAVSSTQQLNKRERYAVYQVFIICSSLMILNITLLALPLVCDSFWIPMVGNVLRIIVVGWFPIIVLTFNITLRKKFLSAIGCKAKNSVEAANQVWAISTAQSFPKS